jgi:hypothetical protein
LYFKNQQTETGQEEDVEIVTEAGGTMEDVVDSSGGHGTQSSQQGIAQLTGSTQMFPNNMGFGMIPGMLPNMGWSGAQDFNAMGQFMPNTMNNFQNPMGTYCSIFLHGPLAHRYSQGCPVWEWTR